MSTSNSSKMRRSIVCSIPIAAVEWLFLPRRLDAVTADAGTRTGTPAGDRRAALTQMSIIALPPAKDVTGQSVQVAMSRRRSVRSFSRRALTWAEIGQLTWAAQGVSDPGTGLRTAPSAGALFPLELDVVIASGIFRYRPSAHSLEQRSAADVRQAVSQAAYGQAWLADASCLLCFAAVVERTARKYGSRASRFVDLEAGHAAENALLMATALGLAATPIGAFDDAALSRTLGLDGDTDPVYLVAVGWPR